MAGRGFGLYEAVTAGAEVDDVLLASPIGPLFVEIAAVLERALAIYERLGDRSGVMSTVIAMAYARYSPVMHLTGSARHLEEIRRVTSRLSELVTESERARLDLQMLFGVHVYARAKVVPDLALSRGEDAHRAARLQGDRTTSSWPRAAWRWPSSSSATSTRPSDGSARRPPRSPPPHRRTRSHPARDMARDGPGRCGRRGRHAPPSREGRRDGHRSGTSFRAVRGAGPAGRRGGAPGRQGLDLRRPDAALVELVERSAAQVKDAMPLLPGHAPWGAQADAALATVALARGDTVRAATLGGAALQALDAAHHEDTSLEILIPAARAVLAGGPSEFQEFVRTTFARRCRGSRRARPTN